MRAEIQERGRWGSHKSVARYEKGGRMQAQWQRLPVNFQQYALWCDKNLKRMFLDGLQPVAAPSLPRSGNLRTSTRVVAASRPK